MQIKLFCGLAAFIVAGCATAPQATYTRTIQVVAKQETAPVPSRTDAADDPAIWIHPEEPKNSLIIATDKDSGLLVYDLQGLVRQYLPLGEFNNVDLRPFPASVAGRQNQTVLAATQRNPSAIALFALDHATGRVELLRQLETELVEPYGTCMYQSQAGEVFVIANSKEGQFVQYQLASNLNLVPVRRWQTATQPEGCVADDEKGLLYFGEEMAGIWRIAADPDAPTEATVVDSLSNGHMVADVEGMSLYHGADQTLLIASSQGDNSYAVFDAADNRYLFSFNVVSDEQIDGSNETDGLDVTSVALPGYPQGLLVVQDGVNEQPTENQNFKLISWAEVIEAAKAANAL